jgi:AhpD family alkylhydroperoxidase
LIKALPRGSHRSVKKPFRTRSINTSTENIVSRSGATGTSGATKTQPANPFGGFRKRTITAWEFAGAMVSIAVDARTLYRIWVRHELDPGFREELMLAVSKVNDCRYCSWAHHEWASIDGISEEELAHVEQMDPARFERKKWLAISFVRELVTVRFGAVSEDLMRKMQGHYTAREISEITLVAKVMDTANLGANTFDAMRSRMRGAPAQGSRILDEVLMTAAFCCVAPSLLVFLALSSKRSIRDLLRSMLDYSKHAEAKQEGRKPSALTTDP